MTHQITRKMKKILLIVGVLFSLNLNAQLTTGSQAPDFTATDINGNTIVLSDILSSGKSVFMDISATWCGPCWGFHQTHAMDQLNLVYGSEGSNEVFVVFVEGDPNTTMADLQGTGSNTQGDWLTGSNYTTIDDASIANAYEITYYPTFYTICQDGTLTHINQQQEYPTYDLIVSKLNACQTLQGAPNHAKIDAQQTYICDENGGDISVQFKNYGGNQITSAHLILKENGNEIASADFSGDLSIFEDGVVFFTDVTANEGSTYVAQITSINGADPHNSDLTSAEITLGDAGIVESNDIEVRTTTDYYPTEMSWKIFDGAGNEVAASNPFVGGPDGGGQDANTVVTQTVSLPGGSDCYSIVLYDSYGDGWGAFNSNYPTPGIAIYSDNSGARNLEFVEVFNQRVANFGSQLNLVTALSASNLSTNELSSRNEFAIYPNPSNGIVNIMSKKSSAVKVFDTAGKLVYTNKKVDANGNLDLTHLPKGVYVMQFASEDGTIQDKKLIIK